jgi:Xaa-Pro aminopeptidase
MYKEKINQAVDILNELNIDMWLTFGRESHTIHDPAADMIIGAGYTWHSAFIITRDGDSAAIIGNLDAANYEKKGNYKKVIPYLKSIKKDLLKYVESKSPKTIAINYSENNVMADGLTHGLFMTLQSYFKGTKYSNNFVSSEGILSALRGRKSETEIKKITNAIRETEKLYNRIGKFIKAGISEKEVHDKMVEWMNELNYEPAWELEMCPSVFTGMPDEGEAHTGATDKLIKKGDVLNMDFGLRIDEYCSDLQETWYILKDGETQAPPEVIRGFEAVRDAIIESAKALKPGVEGRVIDAVSRKVITDRGYDEYPHALGHQVGRAPHDGGGNLCPEWERYGNQPYMKIEENQIYTLEPRVRIEGYGTATVEEIVVVTKNGGKFLSKLQEEIYLI